MFETRQRLLERCSRKLLIYFQNQFGSFTQRNLPFNTGTIGGRNLEILKSSMLWWYVSYFISHHAIWNIQASGRIFLIVSGEVDHWSMHRCCITELHETRLTWYSQRVSYCVFKVMRRFIALWLVKLHMTAKYVTQNLLKIWPDLMVFFVMEAPTEYLMWLFFLRSRYNTVDYTLQNMPHENV